MELSGRPRDPSGALQGQVLEHFGSFWGVMLVVFFACGGSQNLALFWSLSKLVFMFFLDFAKMADIVHDS